MEITKYNYEPFLVDYLEGKLKPWEEKILFQFLKNNPEIEIELIGLNHIVLEHTNETFTSKNIIKKKEYEQFSIKDEFEYMCVQELEKNISIEELNKLNEASENDKNIKTQRVLFSNTKLKKDRNIVFTKKSALKRVSLLGVTQKTARALLGVAASLVFIFSIYPFISIINKNTEELLASFEDETVIIEDFTKNELKVVALSNELNNSNKTNELLLNNSIDLSDITIDNINHDTIEISRTNKIETILLNKIEIQTDSEKIASLTELLKIEHPKQQNPNNQTSAKEERSSKTSTKEIGFFELAQLGIEKISNITGLAMKLEARKDEEGAIKKINFESELFAISRPVKNK